MGSYVEEDISANEIECPHCGERVYVEALTCPKCGLHFYVDEGSEGVTDEVPAQESGYNTQSSG